MVPPPPHVSGRVHAPQVPPQLSAPHGFGPAHVGVHVHVLELHIAGKTQRRPQRPQLLLSLVVSTQPPEQFVNPVAHPLPHTLPVQTGADVPQTVPQAPQLEGSVAVLVQTPAHAVWPVGHTHDPPEQCVPPVQCVPQPPQLVSLLEVSTQTPEQFV